MVKSLLKGSKKVSLDNVKALIVPHAGLIYSGIVAASGYNLLKKLSKKHCRIILLGPSHHVSFHGVSTSKSDYWETPLGKVKITKSEFNEVKFSHSSEHCLEVQLPFLQLILKDFEVLPLVLGSINPEELARDIVNIMDSSTIIIASSDLSHFHDYNTAINLDSRFNESIPRMDIKTTEDGEACGLSAILTLMHIAKMKKWYCSFIDYRNSGDVTNDKKRVVGYGCYAFYSR